MSKTLWLSDKTSRGFGFLFLFLITFDLCRLSWSNPLNGYRYELRTLVNKGLMSSPQSLVLDQDREALYITDTGHHCLKRMQLPSDLLNYDVKTASVDVVTLVGQCGTAKTAGDGVAENAFFAEPFYMVMDHPKNQLLVLEKGSSIRRVDLQNLGVTSSALPRDAAAQATAIVPVSDNAVLFASSNQKLNLWWACDNEQSFSATFNPMIETSDGQRIEFVQITAMVKNPWDGSVVLVDAGAHQIFKLSLSLPHDCPSDQQRSDLDMLRFFFNVQPQTSQDEGYKSTQINQDIDQAIRSATVAVLGGTRGLAGYHDGQAMHSVFNQPTAIACDTHDQRIYVADRGNNAIRVIRNNVVSTLELHGNPKLVAPTSIAVLRNTGEVIIAEPHSNLIRIAVPVMLTSSPERSGRFWSFGLMTTTAVCVVLVGGVIVIFQMRRQHHKYKAVIPKSYIATTF